MSDILIVATVLGETYPVPQLASLLSPNGVLDLPMPADADDVTSEIISLAQAPGSYLTTTAWQRLGVTRTLLANLANVTADYTTTELTEMSEGYLVPCAQLVDSNGNAITGPLDTLAEEMFFEFRSAATYAAGPVPIVNATPSPMTLEPLTLIVMSTLTQATYTNLGTITLPALSTTNATLTATTIGSGSSAAKGTIFVPTPPIEGLSCGPLAGNLVGLDAGLNGSLLERCQNQLEPVAVDGASTIWEQVATATDPTLTRVIAQPSPQFGTVGVFLATAFKPASPAQVAAVSATYAQGYTGCSVNVLVYPATTLVVTVTGILYVPVGSPVTNVTLLGSIYAALLGYLGELPIGGIQSSSGLIIPGSALLTVIMSTAQLAVGPSYASGVRCEAFFNGVYNGDIACPATAIGQLVDLLGLEYVE